MTLFLQTNIPGKIYLWVTAPSGRIRIRRVKSIAFHGSDQLLVFINRTLTKNHIALRSIRSVVVVRGPGPFTAVRNGIVIANTLGWLLNIPVLGVIAKQALADQALRLYQQRVSKSTKRPALVRPWYGKQPNITRPKKN